MAQVSIALLQANNAGASVQDIARQLQLPEQWVSERIEAARLSIMIADSMDI
jgi:DNA-binding Lrp family transcriptional regulator